LLDPNSREGTVVRGLRAAAASVEEIERWLERRSWSPSRVTPSQRQALQTLHEKATLLQQYLGFLRDRADEADSLPHAAFTER
jgi:hypothetical protein